MSGQIKKRFQYRKDFAKLTSYNFKKNMVNIPDKFSKIEIKLDPSKPFRSLQEVGVIDRPTLDGNTRHLPFGNSENEQKPKEEDIRLNRNQVEAYVNRTLWHLTPPGTGLEFTGEGETPKNWAGPVKAQYTLNENVLTVKFTPERVAEMENQPYGPIPGASIEDKVIRTQVASCANMFRAWLEALESEGHSVEFK